MQACSLHVKRAVSRCGLSAGLFCRCLREAAPQFLPVNRGEPPRNPLKRRTFRVTLRDPDGLWSYEENRSARLVATVGHVPASSLSAHFPLTIRHYALSRRECVDALIGALPLLRHCSLRVSNDCIPQTRVKRETDSRLSWASVSQRCDPRTRLWLGRPSAHGALQHVAPPSDVRTSLRATSR